MIRRLRRRRLAGDPDAAALLRECIEDVGAAVHEVPKDRLVGEHLRQYRRTRSTALLAVLSVVALVGLAVVATQADERRRLAIAAQLVQRAAVARDVDPRLALLLEIAADRIHPTH